MYFSFSEDFLTMNNLKTNLTSGTFGALMMGALASNLNAVAGEKPHFISSPIIPQNSKVFPTNTKQPKLYARDLGRKIASTKTDNIFGKFPPTYNLVSVLNAALKHNYSPDKSTVTDFDGKKIIYRSKSASPLVIKPDNHNTKLTHDVTVNVYKDKVTFDIKGHGTAGTSSKLSVANFKKYKDNIYKVDVDYQEFSQGSLVANQRASKMNVEYKHLKPLLEMQNQLKALLK
jgi:hypothetical protein